MNFIYKFFKSTIFFEWFQIPLQRSSLNFFEILNILTFKYREQILFMSFRQCGSKKSLSTQFFSNLHLNNNSCFTWHTIFDAETVCKFERKGLNCRSVSLTTRNTSDDAMCRPPRPILKPCQKYMRCCVSVVAFRGKKSISTGLTSQFNG